MDGVAGVDVPGSEAERRAWFGDDAACLDFLDRLRWGAGFSCPSCGAARSWVLPDGRRSCAGCRRRVSPTAGTLLHRARSPLPLWFAAAWALAEEEGGTTASELQRRLALPSYQTAWAMLHRLRRAMGGPGVAALEGAVDVGVARLAGAVASGGSGPVVAVAVERLGAGTGRCRLQVVPSGRRAPVQAFLDGALAPGAIVQWSPRGRPTGAVAAVVEVVTAWLRERLHGAVGLDHLDAYLDEAAFRLDGRGPGPPGARFAGLLALVLATGPVPAAGLVATHPGRRVPPTPPAHPRRPPPRRGGTGAAPPWRPA